MVLVPTQVNKWLQVNLTAGGVTPVMDCQMSHPRGKDQNTLLLHGNWDILGADGPVGSLCRLNLPLPKEATKDSCIRRSYSDVKGNI